MTREERGDGGHHGNREERRGELSTIPQNGWRHGPHSSISSGQNYHRPQPGTRFWQHPPEHNPPKAVPPLSSAVGEGEAALRRPQGWPAESKNKPKPPIIITRDSANMLWAHAMEVSPGCNVTESLAVFARRNHRGIWVLSASGCVTNVTLRQPASSGSVVTLHGRFEILSMLGSVLPPPAPLGVTGLTIYLAQAQGQVVGGGVVGALIASSPVVIMATMFMNATFDRLPLDDDEEAVSTMAQNQHYQNNRLHHRIDGVDVYGMPQNLLTNGSFPPELYSWAPGRMLSKT
ncbi:hypothetical protein LguiB_013348 [Lonicera macranthoides]